MNTRKRSSSLGVVVFVVAAVLFAALAGVLLSNLLGRNYSKDPVRNIVVAARDIPSGTPLAAADLRMVPWPVSSIPKGAHGSIKLLLAKKAVPLTPLVAGEPVLRSHLSRPESGIGVAAKLGPSERAISLSTDMSVTLARLIYPGASVDVLATLRRPGFRTREVKTKVILQRVRVLAVGRYIDAMSALRRQRNTSKKAGMAALQSSRNRRSARVVTLAVSPEQAERLVLARREGKIDFVLRSPSDDREVDTPGSTANSILGEELADDSERGRAAPAPAPEVKRMRDRRRSLRRPSRRRASGGGGPHIDRLR